jgi:hypothetical protein
MNYKLYHISNIETAYFTDVIILKVCDSGLILWENFL